MTRAVLFDLDGVLVDTFEVWLATLDDVASRLGYPAIGREAYRACFGTSAEDEVRLFFPRHTVDEIQRLYGERYGAHLHHLKVMDGARGFLEALRLPMAVVTNSPIGVARSALSTARLEAFFGTVVGADEVARGKPAPDLVVEACRRLGVRPEEALVIGDSRYDEAAARAAGCRFLMFRSFAELSLKP